MVVLGDDASQYQAEKPTHVGLRLRIRGFETGLERKSGDGKCDMKLTTRSGDGIERRYKYPGGLTQM